MMRFAAIVLLLSPAHCFLGANPKSSLKHETKDATQSFELKAESSGNEKVVVDKRAERRKIISSEKYNRMGFKEEAEDVSSMMLEEFTSPFIKEFKATNNIIKKGDVTLKLAEKYGFCWGVERAIAMSFQARKHFPGSKMHITNELIHNPGVNEKLTEMNIKLVPNEKGKKDFSDIQDGDVVILPAFGATLEEMKFLDSKDVKVVDTTCPWVSKVWTTVDKHTKNSFTTIMHGKYEHEETIATSSFAETYIIVKNMKEAEYVIEYMLHGGNKDAFLNKFSKAISEGFDPDIHLDKVGLANQTTMYKRETREIGKAFEKALMEKFGPEKLTEHYIAYDTICDATQERQDAILELIEDPEINMMLVVGGWDSSNTHHLAEISADKGIPTFWVNRAACIKPDGSIDHKDPHSMEEINTADFLPEGKLCMGVTSGASTPDAYVEEAIENIFMLKELRTAGKVKDIWSKGKEIRARLKK